LKPVLFAEGLEEEIGAAAVYLEERQEGLGNEFLQSVTEVLQRLPSRPGIHPLVQGTDPKEKLRRARVGRFSYRLVFRERATDIFVLPCMHDARRPGYWRTRDT